MEFKVMGFALLSFIPIASSYRVIVLIFLDGIQRYAFFLWAAVEMGIVYHCHRMILLCRRWC